MERITYYIGAGASYHSLPLIKTMNSRMRAFSTFLKIQKEEGNLKHKFSDQFIADLDKLINIESNRTSIDTYAKELYINGKHLELNKVKLIISSYLIFEQLIKPDDITFFSEEFDYNTIPYLRVPLSTEIKKSLSVSIDKRYFTFWAEYLSPKIELLPDNIKILSWNYDMQFEASYSKIKSYSLELTQQNLQVFPSEQNEIDITRSCLLKLNGTAGLFSEQPYNKNFNLFDLNSHLLMENLDFLINPLAQNYHRIFTKTLFSFAWENEGITYETRKYAKQIMEETTTLVIIGYSFPNFNREIDRSIFANIPDLKYVYYQAPKEELESSLISRLDAINPKLRSLTIPISDLSTFYIPS